MALGNPAGALPHDAAFSDGKYWYINAQTDDLRSISFNPGGTIASDDFVADLLGNAGVLGFGDIAIKDGILYGDGLSTATNRIVFFTVDLSAPTTSYTEHQDDDPATTKVLQLAFGGEGTLFGQTGALTGEQDLYYVSLVPATLGERGLVLTDFSGGPYTDMSSFNPLCACIPSLLCHIAQSGEGQFELYKRENVIQSHLDHGDCRQDDAIFLGVPDDLNACACP